MIRSNKGLTLVELLCTMLIMLMVFATVNVGIRLATDSYVRSITASESEVLCTTVLDAVSDELRFAEITDWPDVRFVSLRYAGVRHFETEDGKVVLNTDPPKDNPLAAPLSDKLLPAKSYPNGLQVALKLTPNQPSKIITVEVKVQNSKDAKLIKRTRDVKILNVPQPEEVDR